MPLMLTVASAIALFTSSCAAATVSVDLYKANCSGSSLKTLTHDLNKCVSDNGIQFFGFSCVAAEKGECIYFASCGPTGFGFNSAVLCDTCLPSFGSFADFYKCNKAAGTYQRFLHYTPDCSGTNAPYGSLMTLKPDCVWSEYSPDYGSKIDVCPKKVIQTSFLDKDCKTASAKLSLLADVCTGSGAWLYHCDAYESPVAASTAAPLETTSSKPTTAKPTTAKPTTAKPTTAKPTTAKPTTAKPTTAKPTTAKPTTAKPTTAKPTTAKPTTAKPTTAKPTTAKPQ